MTVPTNILRVALAVAGLCAFAATSEAAVTDNGGESKARPAANSDEIVIARGGRGGGARGGASRGGARATTGGGGRSVRGSASSSVNHRVDGNRNANRNVNRNTNRNVNRNVNVDGDWNGGYGRDWDDHPIAAGAAIAATAAVVGSIVHSVPSNCGTVDVGGVNYYQCGDSWYQPQYSGTSVQYTVVNAPQ